MSAIYNFPCCPRLKPTHLVHVEVWPGVRSQEEDGGDRIRSRDIPPGCNSFLVAMAELLSCRARSDPGSVERENENTRQEGRLSPGLSYSPAPLDHTPIQGLGRSSISGGK